jgi:hypothetical protein
MADDNRTRSFSRWGLRHNPFISLPPLKEEDRQHVFTGRQEEVNKLVGLMTPPRGVFLFGLFGIGKSILALETLRRLAEQGAITAYAKYDREIGFSRSVLKKLAVVTAHMHPVRVREILTKGTKQTSKDSQMDQKHIEEAVYSTPSVMSAVEGILELHKTAGTLVAVVVDDLDKGTDIGDINEIIQDTRQLIELGCSVILPGHSFGPTAGFSSSADILYPLPLKPLSERELVQMMGKYLDLAHVQNFHNEVITYPFTSAAAELIANGIAGVQLTPRIFNFACQLLLDQAADEDAEHIDEQFLAEKWGVVAERFLMKTLREEDKRYLEAIYKDGGELSEDTRDSIREIGGPFAEYAQVRNTLAKLIQENVLIEKVKDGKRRMTRNPIIDKDFFFYR